eukprot:TRINITY_DN346_c0_g4_i1.p1 TRINITY_DN346_c0_g4~~TRINITY_DN346_c0_g4_i1.p1  ORF type:complete len:286 (-),score=-42.03 TRINITY_DN346_c0_g4_i1:344-1201(-)
MPIIEGDKLSFEEVEDVSEISLQRVVQIYSSDQSITMISSISELFQKQMYSLTEPEEASDDISFDLDYKSKKARFKSGSGFLYDEGKLVTTFDNLKLLSNMPVRNKTEQSQIDHITQIINDGKLLCYRAYDNKERKISAIKDYSIEKDWIKLETDSKFPFDTVSNLFSDDDDQEVIDGDYSEPSVNDEIQMLGHPLGVKIPFKTNGYITDSKSKLLSAFLSFFPGSSGSPVFNSDGIFIGICTENPDQSHFIKNGSRYELLKIDINIDGDELSPLKIIQRDKLKI